MQAKAEVTQFNAKVVNAYPGQRSPFHAPYLTAQVPDVCHFPASDAFQEARSSGVLLVRDRTGRVLARFEALGRGSRGAGNTQMLVNGNTPTGTYRASRVIPTACANLNSYGPNGAIVLDPVSGNARAAEKIAGREGLLIHGGSLGGTTYWRGKNELRATHGCIRLRNEDMKRLMNLMFDESLSALQCTPVEVLVTVSDYPVTFDRPSGRMTARVP